jgi:hypothetical protein
MVMTLNGKEKKTNLKELSMDVKMTVSTDIAIGTIYDTGFEE